MTSDPASAPLSVSAPEPPAATAREVRARHADNRAAWNQGAAWYTKQLEESIAFLRAGKSNLHPVERGVLGDLRAWCRRAVHLQCASGHDTLSLWVEGVAEVVGVDISDVHIENARRKSEALGAPARWYRCDVLDVPAELDGWADLVYTGRGALFWLHDLTAWARTCARLLAPGGVLSVFDTHPFSCLFDLDAAELRLRDASYFGQAERSKGWPATYIGDLGLPPEELAVMHERLWTLAEVHVAVVGAGLVVEHLGEHAEDYWDALPNLADEQKRRIPLTFSLRARKPV